MNGLQQQIMAGANYIQPYSPTPAWTTYTTTICNCGGTQSMSKSNFEVAFKIAQLMVGRPTVATNELKAFLDLVKDIEAALSE